jgi:hypothetical protein
MQTQTPLNEYLAPRAEVFSLNIKRTILSLSNESVGGRESQDIDWGE